MTSPHSPPLTPPACDLRGLPYMPLDVVRLLDSDLFALSTGEEFKASVALWCKSWNQVPAGSIPADERVLARLAGVSLAEWRTIAEMALRGWVPCSDGRLYHPVVAQKALQAWIERIGHRRRSAQGNAKRYGHEFNAMPFDQAIATAEELLGRLHPGREAPTVNLVEFPEGDEIVPRKEPETLLEGLLEGAETAPKRREQKGREQKEEEEAKASLSSEADAHAAEPPTKQRKRVYPADFEVAWRAYPHHPGRSSKPDALTEWVKLPKPEREGMEGAIERFLPKVETTCGGKGAPDMARWLKHGKHLNWLENEPVNRVALAIFPGPAEIRSAVLAMKGEDWVRSYLDQSGWDEAETLVIPHNGHAADRMRRELGALLAERGVSIGEPRQRRAA